MTKYLLLSQLKNFICFGCILYLSNTYSQSLGPWDKTSLDPQGLKIQLLIVIDDVLYATGEAGLWKKNANVDEWVKVHDLPYSNYLVKHNGTYVLGSWYDGIWESEDLISWSPLILDDGHIITSVTSDETNLYIGTDNGVFKLEGSTKTFIKEPLSSQSIHNNYFGYVLLTENYVVAFGCNFVYYKAKDSINWQSINFQFDYCGLTAENINGEVFFSTSGDGVYKFTPGEFIVVPANISDTEELKHVISIYSKDQWIYLLYLTGLYTSDGYREEIGGNNLTDIVFQEDAYYVSTTRDGVWKSTGVIPISKNPPFAFSATPSLSKGLVNIKLENIERELYQISIVDMQGQIVKYISFDNQYNYFGFEDAIFIPSPGIYVIHCYSPSNLSTQRIVIMN